MPVVDAAVVAALVVWEADEAVEEACVEDADVDLAEVDDFVVDAPTTSLRLLMLGRSSWRFAYCSKPFEAETVASRSERTSAINGTARLLESL